MKREEITVLSRVYDFIPLLTVSEMGDQTQSDNHQLVMAAGAGAGESDQFNYQINLAIISADWNSESR